jgi:hypothetical protein
MSVSAKARPTAPSKKGEASPVSEPQLRRRDQPVGRRVGAVLPNDLFAAFRHYVALHGTTGDQVIREAVRRIVDEA